VTKPQIKWISRDEPPDAFPAISSALRSPNGLLAAGGDLDPERLLHAYEHAIFPWFDTGQPILWWSPDPRCILLPEDFHLARRFNRMLKTSTFRVTFNETFDSVIAACGAQRDGHSGTWITPGMIAAFSKLHRLGWAHSVEVWLDDRLVGGIYGIAIGGAFFGESMFSRVANASKVALLALCRQLVTHEFRLLDCQVPSRHLMSLGATLMPREKFADLLRTVCIPRRRFDKWPGSPIDAMLLADA